VGSADTVSRLFAALTALAAVIRDGEPFDFLDDPED
jgi:hypothetical protein